MILPIYVYGQPVLRKVAEDITPDYPNLKELIANMFETMVHADGVGLAAPQIGLPIRVVTITLDPLSRQPCFLHCAMRQNRCKTFIHIFNRNIREAFFQ